MVSLDSEDIYLVLRFVLDTGRNIDEKSLHLLEIYDSVVRKLKFNYFNLNEEERIFISVVLIKEINEMDPGDPVRERLKKIKSEIEPGI